MKYSPYTTISSTCRVPYTGNHSSSHVTAHIQLSMGPLWRPHSTVGPFVIGRHLFTLEIYNFFIHEPTLKSNSSKFSSWYLLFIVIAISRILFYTKWFLAGPKKWLLGFFYGVQKNTYFSSNQNQTFQICLYTTWEEFHKKFLYIYIYVRIGG